MAEADSKRNHVQSMQVFPGPENDMTGVQE